MIMWVFCILFSFISIFSVKVILFQTWYRWSLKIPDLGVSGLVVVDIECIQMIDISALCIHPACVISVTLTALKSEPTYTEQIRNNSFVLNVSGRLHLVNQHDVLYQVICFEQIFRV